MRTMKVYCVFEVYTSPYPEDWGKTLVKVFDSRKNAESFIEEQKESDRYYYDEEYECSLQGVIEEFDVL